MNSIMYVAFFDLDHTILNTSSGSVMFRSVYKRGMIGIKQMCSMLKVSLLYRLGFISAEATVVRWLALFKGLSVDALKNFTSEWNVELKSFIREDARKEIAYHRNNGALTVIISASPTFICEEIQAYIGMDDILCTELEVKDGSITGNLKGRYCHDEEKLTRARRYCGERGLKLADAFFYSDSINDIPLLEAVGHPMCVTPDSKLKRTALKRRWQICFWQ